MTDLFFVFILGPVFFLPRLLSFSIGSISELYIFIASGLGTTVWAMVIGAIVGLVK